MTEAGRATSTSRRVVLTFVFGLPLCLALVALVYFAGSALTLVILIPILVIVIYLLPGHGEALPAGDARSCPRCSRPSHQVPNTMSWRCEACGNLEQLEPGTVTPP